MRRPFPLINLLLFLATVVTTLAAGAQQALPNSSLGELLRTGAIFSAAILAILGIHELGHFVLAQLHRVDATWPYFIPVPFGPLGTLGAFIRIRSALPSRRAILEIGAAGPIAGFLVALPLLFWGFAHSEVVSGLPAPTGGAMQSPFALARALLRGEPLGAGNGAVMIMGDSVITWLAARLTHGALPAGSDLSVHPVAFAAWIGMYVTTLNLIPIGQLDGGHVVYALFGKHGERVSRMAAWALLAVGVFASWSWLVWWVVVRFVVGVRHPAPADVAPLTPAGRTLALASLGILALTFVPVPFRF